MVNFGHYNEISKTTMLLIFASVLMVASCGSGNFYQDVDITWGGERAKVCKGGQLLSLSLHQFSRSGFQSKDEFLFGRIDVQLKRVSGNSAGTVAAFYLSSRGPTHDEIDFEFLGNVSGQPYTVHTNVFTQGIGNREQQFRPWFDPTAKFHTYSVIWNPQNIIFLVDKIPIRVFKNEERRGIAYPKDQPMRVHSSLWNADDWATQGGHVKTDWSNAPFTVFYKHLNIMTPASCVVSSSSPSSSSSSPSCASTPTNSGSVSGWWTQGLDGVAWRSLRWVQKHYMIYNYCTDFKRFPYCLPPECKR